MARKDPPTSRKDNAMTQTTHKSFAAAMSALKLAQNREDVRKAQNLRKSAPLAARKTTPGPRIAR
jgi:hypothetical protein